MSTTYPSVAKEVHEDVNPNVPQLKDVYFDHETQQLYLSVGDESWTNHDAYYTIIEYKLYNQMNEQQKASVDVWSYFNIK
ncbi:hypothetical protein [Leptolyngbya phage Lsp-JY17]